MQEGIREIQDNKKGRSAQQSTTMGHNKKGNQQLQIKTSNVKQPDISSKFILFTIFTTSYTLF
jgi:hypothetical protein